LYVTVNVH